MDPITAIIIASGIAVSVDAPGTYIDVGMAVHATSYDDPEYLAENPIATYEVGYTYNRLSVYFRHESSIPQWEYGYGFNKLGVEYRIFKGGKRK